MISLRDHPRDLARDKIDTSSRPRERIFRGQLNRFVTRSHDGLISQVYTRFDSKQRRLVRVGC